MVMPKPHTATVEPYLGSGAGGDTYGAGLEVPCYYEGRRQIVRGDNGDEVVSEAVMFTDLRDDITPDSKVTVLGRTTWVITISTFDDGSVLGHLEVALA